MEASTMKKPCAVIFVAVAVMIMALLPGFTGCSSLVLSEDPEELEFLQKVFPEAGYYQYDEEAEIYTVYDAGKKSWAMPLQGQERVMKVRLPF